MGSIVTRTRTWLLSSALLLNYPVVAANAQDSQQTPQSNARSNSHYRIPTVHVDAGEAHAAYQAGRRVATRSYGISCVPYARQVSGIHVPGNAWQWWDNAHGLYARGEQPEVGSVLNFRSNGRMQLGHVAVVTQVVNAREVMVDQANWPSGGAGYGRISHNVAVVDVSEANNWSAVRVQLGRGQDFGSVYPTYGFIYKRPDTGFVTASVTRPAPQPSINRVPSDLRPVAERPWHTVEEVAEAPSGPSHWINPRSPAGTTRP